MSESVRPAVAITGANGYVGSTLSAAFAASGYRVIVLQRSAPVAGSTDYLPYSLQDGLAAALPDDVAAVVHCAYDLHARDRTEIEHINLGGTEKLIRAVGDVPIVLISSMSAYSGTSQIYGGMIGALRKVAALPVVPMLRPDSYQYAIHAEDVADCVVATVKQAPAHRVLGVAAPRRVPFSEIIRSLRAAATSSSLRPIPVSSALLYRALRAAEAAGLRIGFRADSLLGLMHPAPDVPHVDYWAERGIPLRDFAKSESFR
jgi:nucleoside-diphosphate-sugar epimerase